MEVYTISGPESPAIAFVLTCMLKDYQRRSSLYAVKCVIVTRCIDAVHTLVMEDDRIGMHLEKLMNVAREKIEWVNAIPYGTWERFHFCIGDNSITVQDVRHVCLRAVYIAMGMLHTRLFNIALGMPWSLLIGDMSQNLDDFLAAEEMPNGLDYVSFKIWRLASLTNGMVIYMYASRRGDM